VKDLTYLS